MARKNTKKTRTTIRRRISNAMTVTVVCMSILLILTVCLMVTKHTKDMCIEEQMQVSSAYAQSIQNKLTILSTQIEAVAGEEAIYDEDTSLDDRKALLANYASSTDFKDFSVAYADGHTYSDTDLSERAYFKEAMNGVTYMSSPLIRKTDGSITIMMGAKSRVDSFNGVVYGGIGYEYFSDMIKAVNFSDSAHSYLLDKDGVIIADSVNEENVRNFVNPIELSATDKDYEDQAEMVEKAISGESDSMIYKSPEGTKVMAAFTPIDGAEGWSLVIERDYSEVTSSYTSILIATICISLLFVVVAILFASRTAKKISQPINVVVESMSKLAEGDFRSNIPAINTNDELEVLGDSLNSVHDSMSKCVDDMSNVLSAVAEGDITLNVGEGYVGDWEQLKVSTESILDSLNDMMSQINDASGYVSEGSENLASGAQSLSAGAIAQAGTIGELSEAMSTITDMINDSAAKAQRATKNTELAAEMSHTGYTQMNQMMDAMNKISDTSNRIVTILNAIEDIAFQTNILALNAAVEAARAGAAGKGFAVVAEEVRNLSAKVSEAASTTNALINESLEAVKDGVKLTQETRETLEKVQNNTNDVANLVREIADDANEQANQINTISGGFTEISTVTANTTATSEEVAASAEELSAQANILKDFVSRFTLR